MNLKLIIKGFIVGIAKIIPGISGAMLALFLGIYEDLIYALTHFWCDKSHNFHLLFNFGLGLILAIILFSKLIIYLLANYYQVTMALFIGLIIGSLLPFIKSVKFTKKNIFIFLITFILSLSIIFINTTTTYIFNNTFKDYLYTFLLGSIDAATSIIPGISGTAIFMMLGSYNYVLSLLSNPLTITFILYGAGVFIGVILISYLMNYLLKNKGEVINSIILAFSLSSIVILLLNMEFNISRVVFLSIGLVISKMLDK